jgi:putative membrane protein
MNPEPAHEAGAAVLDTGTRLAFLRTALSLISFGFAIAKFFEFLREKRGEHAPLVGPRTVGILMISIGIVSLGLADLRHLRAVRGLRERCPDLPPSLAAWSALAITLLGTLALIGALFR